MTTKEQALARVSPALANALGIAEFEVPKVLELIAAASGLGSAAPVGEVDLQQHIEDATADLRKEIADLKSKLDAIEGGETSSRDALNDVASRVGKLEGQHDKLSASFKALASEEPASGSETKPLSQGQADKVLGG